jgi:hypothetical protein
MKFDMSTVQSETPTYESSMTRLKKLVYKNRIRYVIDIPGV